MTSKTKLSCSSRSYKLVQSVLHNLNIMATAISISQASINISQRRTGAELSMIGKAVNIVITSKSPVIRITKSSCQCPISLLRHFLLIDFTHISNSLNPRKRNIRRKGISKSTSIYLLTIAPTSSASGSSRRASSTRASATPTSMTHSI